MSERAGKQAMEAMGGLHGGCHGGAELREVGGKGHGLIRRAGGIERLYQRDFPQGMQGGGAGEGERDFGVVEEVHFAREGAPCAKGSACRGLEGAKGIGHPGDEEAGLGPPGFAHEDSLTMFHGQGFSRDPEGRRVPAGEHFRSHR